MKLIQNLLHLVEVAEQTSTEDKPKGPKTIEELIWSVTEMDKFEMIQIDSTMEKRNGDVVIEVDGWWYERNATNFHEFLDELKKSPLVASVEQAAPGRGSGDRWLVVKKKGSRK